MGFQMAVNLLQQSLIIRTVLLQILQASQWRCENESDSTVSDDV